jgi:hypothetical protein
VFDGDGGGGAHGRGYGRGVRDWMGERSFPGWKRQVKRLRIALGALRGNCAAAGAADGNWRGGGVRSDRWLLR